MAWTMPTDSILSMLLPWVPTLVEMELAPRIEAHYVASLEDPAPIWIAWKFPDDPSPESLTRKFEAIELLVLMALADLQAFLDFVEMLHSFDRHPLSYLWKDVRETVPARRVSGYDVVCSKDVHVTHLHEYLAQKQDAEDELAVQFKRVRADFEARVATLVIVPVRLRMELGLSQSLLFDRVFPAVVEFAAFHSSLASNCRLARFRSRFVEMVNPLDPFVRADDPYLRNVMALHAYGLPTRSQLRLEVEISPANAVFLMQMLCTLVSPASDCPTEHVIRSVRVELNKISTAVPLWSAVAGSGVDCDALVDSPSEAAAAVSGHDRKRFIQWFAYAALHTHGRAPSNKVARIRCGPFTSQDVHWMQEILTHQDPLQILFQHDQESIQQHERHRINTSKVSLYDPMEMAEGDAAVSDGLNLKRLRVLKREGEWWVVLVPGWGRGWVHTSDAEVSSAPPSAPSLASPIVGLPSRADLVLALSVDTKDGDGCGAALAFLQLIGPRVHSLTLSNKSGPNSVWMPAVFPSCPNLVRLQIEFGFGIPVRLETLAEDFAVGHCPKLRHLTLEFEDIAYESVPSVSTLLRSLADKSHPMAKQLDVLSVEAGNMVDGRDYVDADVHDMALRVLENNLHLTQLAVQLPLATTTPERVPEMQRQFDAHHNVLLPEGCTRLGPREKTAFLSVAWGEDDEVDAGVRCTLQQLDTAVISRIFQFITRQRHRLIRIAMPGLPFEEEEDDE